MVRRVNLMKSLLALVALSLAAMALVPTAQAHVAPPRPEFPLCEPAVVGNVCFSPYWPGCNVWIEWTAIPMQPTCLYRSDPLTMSAAGPDVQCMDVYSETELVGGYWLVRRDSCSAQLYQCPAGYSPPAPPCQEVQLLSTSATASGPDLQCMEVYSRTDVHTVSIVRTNSCAPPELYQCPAPGAPLSTCTPLLGLSAAAALPEVQEPNCYSIYNEYHVGPVTVIQRSSCSYEILLCGERDFTQVDPDRCPRLLETTAAQGVPDLPPMSCYDIYSRWGYGPVFVVMTSSCSGYVELCGEPAQYRDLSCLLPIRAAAGVPEVDTPPVYCMPYEREFGVNEDVQVVQGGCGSYARVCGDRVTPDWDGDVSCITDDLATVNCYAIYWRADVGPAALVMTSSCSGHLELCGDRVSPFAAPDLSCVATTAAAAGPEPQCLQVYREYTVGPVHYVSRDSCHSEVDVCGDDAKELPSADPAALAACAVDSWGILA